MQTEPLERLYISRTQLHSNSSADMSKMKMGLSDEATEAFMARFDSLEKKFDELMPKIAPKRSGGLKKEANENE